MSDPLSIASGIAGLISLGIQVSQTLVDFYTAYKGQDENVARTTQKIQSLLPIFCRLDVALAKREFRQDEEELIGAIESSIRSCEDIIQELEAECQKFDKTSAQNLKDRIRVAGRRATYPFRQSTLIKLNEDIDEIRNCLSLPLGILQLEDNKQIHDDITDIKVLLEHVRASQVSTEIREWFRAPDATVNHNIASGKRHSGTCMWFIKSPSFNMWLFEDNSFLWIHGFTGCGKTVMCSTAIQFTFRWKGHDPGTGIAFFYFTFNDETKKDQSAMLRSLLLQLSGQVHDGNADLVRLYTSCAPGTPLPSVLIEYLRQMMKRFQNVYILIDALDECPRYDERDDVLNALETMRKWSLPGLHLLVTSRDEPDIRESLRTEDHQQVSMKKDKVDQDIAEFVSSRLNMDPRLRKWRSYQDQIQKALTEGARGVFRWVECQFEALKRCPPSERHLNMCLQSLPRNLDDTYERMLCCIEEDCAEDARRILTMLSFSARPLTVEELIDGIAVDLNQPAHFDFKNRLIYEDGLHEICPGLLEITVEEVEQPWGRLQPEYQRPLPQMKKIVRIAHFSVQEYLESERITQQRSARYALNNRSGHAEMAHICIVYLHEPKLFIDDLDKVKLAEFPLAQYAAEFLFDHYKKAEQPEGPKELALIMFQQRKEAFFTWLRLSFVEDEFHQRTQPTLPSRIGSSVYYASLLGLDSILSELISLEGLNTLGGCYGSPIQAASYRGQETALRMLLERGSNVYTDLCNALHTALAFSQNGIVQILLDNNADVNVYDWEYRTALQVACMKGNIEIVHLLLKADAEVNQQGGKHGTALQLAAYGGYTEIVQTLLDYGADANAQCGELNTALQAASRIGDKDIVRILLDHKADVNIQGGQYGGALPAAAGARSEEVVQILLDHGADVNIQGEMHGAALQLAASQGFEEIVQILLDHGADVNIQNESNRAALQAAAKWNHKKTLEILLKHGANVNIDGGWGTALQMASGVGHKEIVQMLLDYNADANITSERYGTALHAAAWGGHQEIVQILLNYHNTNVNIQSGPFDTALQAASAFGHREIVVMLLEHNADVNLQGGEYGSALKAALKWPHNEIAEMLRANGADDQDRDA